jgi:hypothetical protein
MFLQIFVVMLACFAASALALMIAGATLAAFGKLLKHTDDHRKEQRL